MLKSVSGPTHRLLRVGYLIFVPWAPTISRNIGISSIV